MHASAGNVSLDGDLVPVFESKHTVSILTVPPDPSCGSTFGVVIYGHPRVLRRFAYSAAEFYATVEFYASLNLSGSGHVHEVAKSRSWSTREHWANISHLESYFRHKGGPSVKRAKSKTPMPQNKFRVDISVQLRHWLPSTLTHSQAKADVLPSFPVTVFDIARWYLEDYYAQDRNDDTGQYHLVATVLGPSYLSGCSQWDDIKDNQSMIHAVRMWIATRIMDCIQHFAQCIFFSSLLGNGKSVELREDQQGTSQATSQDPSSRASGRPLRIGKARGPRFPLMKQTW